MSETTSPQTTWTAGMTKGVAPRELIAELKRNKSAPDFEEEEEDSLPSGSHPLDILRRGRKEENSLAKSRSLPPKDSSKELLSKQSAGLMSKASGGEFDTLSSAQVVIMFSAAQVLPSSNQHISLQVHAEEASASLPVLGSFLVYELGYKASSHSSFAGRHCPCC